MVVKRKLVRHRHKNNVLVGDLRQFFPLSSQQEPITVPEVKPKPKAKPKKRKADPAKRQRVLDPNDPHITCTNCGMYFTQSFQQVAKDEWGCDVDGFGSTCLLCAAKQIFNNQEAYENYPDEVFIQIRKFFHDRARAETGFTGAKPKKEAK